MQKKTKTWCVVFIALLLAPICSAPSEAQNTENQVTIKDRVLEPAPQNLTSDDEQQQRIEFLTKETNAHLHRFVARRGKTLASGSISATLRLPIALPRERRALEKVLKSQNLVTARVVWQRAHGSRLEVEETLNGDDVTLSKFWRQRLNFDEGVSWTMEIYAEKALDRALRTLMEKAAKSKTLKLKA
jgi:hypothetical protein